MGGELETTPASLFDFTSQVALRQSLFFTKPMIDNFVFRKEWWDVLKGCSPEVRQEVYEAIMIYAFEDRVVAMSDMSGMAFAFIRPQIDAMRDKYRARCEQNRENASGRNRTQANATDGKQSQPNASGRSDSQPYNNNNNNNNGNINNNSECESDNSAPTHTHEEFEKFIEFCRAKAPLSLAFEEQLSVDVFDWLVAKYGLYKVQCCASDLHNKEAYKKNRNANNTYKRWIKNIS